MISPLLQARKGAGMDGRGSRKPGLEDTLYTQDGRSQTDLVPMSQQICETGWIQLTPRAKSQKVGGLLARLRIAEETLKGWRKERPGTGLRLPQQRR